MSKPKIKWKNEPEPEDYEGAKNFLTLICSDAEALQLIEHLRKAIQSSGNPKTFYEQPIYHCSINPTRMSMKT